MMNNIMNQNPMINMNICNMCNDWNNINGEEINPIKKTLME